MVNAIDEASDKAMRVVARETISRMMGINETDETKRKRKSIIMNVECTARINLQYFLNQKDSQVLTGIWDPKLTDSSQLSNALIIFFYYVKELVKKRHNLYIYYTPSLLTQTIV